MTDAAPHKPAQPELVASGTFLVDRARALRRLRDYQFEDPKAFLLPWIRCAVLSGATSVDARALGDGLIVRFDGKPLAAERLKQPYAALFEDEADGERYRHLAVGLLASLRLRPRHVAVTSGADRERRRLMVYSLEEPETLSEPPSPGSGPPTLGGREETEVAVAWPESMLAAVGLSSGASQADAALALLRGACGMLRIPLTIGEAKVPAEGSGERPSVSFEEDGMRGVLVAHAPGEPRQVHLYRQGVRVMSKPLNSDLSIVAHVDDDRFKLDASHGKIVEDEEFQGFGQRAVARHVDELLLKVCDEQSKHAAAQTRDALGTSGLTGLPLTVVLRLMIGGAVALPGAARLASVEREAWLAAWLRRAAASRLELAKLAEVERAAPGLKALWETPLYVSVTGKPLSLLQLARQWEDVGRVYYSMPSIRYPDPWVFGFEPTVPIVWLIDADEYCLRSLFEGKLREWQAFDTLWDLTKIAALKARGLR